MSVLYNRLMLFSMDMPDRGFSGERAGGGVSSSSGLDTFVKALGSSDTSGNGQVLVIVKERELATLLAYCLTAAGFRVRLGSHDVDKAIASMTRDFPDVVLLDSRLPGLRSTDIWRQLRSVDDGRRPPAVVMFIRSEDDIDPRLGLDLGPCDFLLYPLSVRDLVLRVDNLVRLRREEAHAGPAARRQQHHYVIGPLDLDVDRHRTLVDNVPILLSPLEMRLLAYLVTHRDRVCTRSELLTEVWGYRPGVVTRAADVHVTRLRDKLGAAASLIVTIRGAGYRLSTEFPVTVKQS
jgi:two-component system, OmpR family, phosphate regulon response regulator PhoB